MYREAVGIQLPDLLQRVAYLVCSLPGKTDDQVHIDIVKSHSAREPELLDCLFYRVFPADQIQRLLIHGLRIDGNAAHRIFLKHAELILRDRIRTSCLHGKFCQVMQIKLPVENRQQLIKTLRRDRGRRAAADIDRVQGKISHLVSNKCQLPVHGMKIRLLHFPAEIQPVRAERTIQTDGRTERNAHIKAVALLEVHPVEDILLSVYHRKR